MGPPSVEGASKRDQTCLPHLPPVFPVHLFCDGTAYLYSLINLSQVDLGKNTSTCLTLESSTLSLRKYSTNVENMPAYYQHSFQWQRRAHVVLLLLPVWDIICHRGRLFINHPSYNIELPKQHSTCAAC